MSARPAVPSTSRILTIALTFIAIMVAIPCVISYRSWKVDERERLTESVQAGTVQIEGVED